MNIFSNIGITELIVILLIALIVVGPERLPEMGRKLAKLLRDFRNMYENLTRDLGPELMSLQETTKELRDSVESVRSIPQDVLKSVVDAADLDDTIDELKSVTESIEKVGQTVSTAGRVAKDPVGAAVGTAREALMPTKSEEREEKDQSIRPEEFEPAPANEVAVATEATPAVGDLTSTDKADEDVKDATAIVEKAETTTDVAEEQAHE
jgi:sec-independent protein translocase protein TatB